MIDNELIEQSIKLLTLTVTPTINLTERNEMYRNFPYNNFVQCQKYTIIDVIIWFGNYIAVILPKLTKSKFNKCCY